MDWTTVATFLSAFATFLVAIATFGAVLLALQLQKRWERRERPILSVTFDKKTDCVRYVKREFESRARGRSSQEQPHVREELWIRVAVSNSGELAARDVEVLLVDVYRDNDKEPENRSRLGFKASSLNSTSVKLLSKGLPRQFDIAFAWHQTPEIDTHFRLITSRPEIFKWDDLKSEIEKDKDNEDRILELAQKYRICFAVQASNAEAVHYEFWMKLEQLGDDGPAADGVQGPVVFEDRLSIAKLETIQPPDIDHSLAKGLGQN